MPAPALITQTAYAELLDRCATDAFGAAFPEKGAFTSKEVKGRRYWYFQLSAESGRIQRYVGRETPELLEQISHHKEARSDERERTALVSSLVRQGMPRPPAELAEVVAALSAAGVFRLGGVLVGTAAYQAYAAMLGEKLQSRELQTGDVDVAQFASTSRNVEDRLARPILEILRGVDKTFGPVPNTAPGERPTNYKTRGGRTRVDFLTPNEGPETDEPQLLPALQTYAQPRRFLDFLIHGAQPAVLLHGAGVYVTVPEPQRYAIHKLIIAQRRAPGAAKRDKDIRQADALLGILAVKRPQDVRTAWEEAANRGKGWRDPLLQGVSQMRQRSRDLTLKAVGKPRSVIPGLDLSFQNPAPRYIFERDVVAFDGDANGEKVSNSISREALEDHFDANNLSIEGRVAKFLENRTAIEALARAKYLNGPIEEDGAVLIRTGDVKTYQGAKSTRTR